MTAYGIKPLETNYRALSGGTQNNDRDVTDDLFGVPVNTTDSSQLFKTALKFNEILESDRLWLECAMVAAAEMDKCKHGGLKVTHIEGELKVEGKQRDIAVLALNLEAFRVAVVN